MTAGPPSPATRSSRPSSSIRSASRKPAARSSPSRPRACTTRPTRSEAAAAVGDVAKELVGEKPDYLGHRKRLRERFLAGGPTALADYELLELLLCQAQPRGDMKPTAKALIKRFGSFAGV